MIGYEIRFSGAEYTDRNGNKWSYKKNNKKYELTKLYFDKETCEYYNEKVENHKDINFNKVLWDKMYNGKLIFTESIEIYNMTVVAWKYKIYNV